MRELLRKRAALMDRLQAMVEAAEERDEDFSDDEQAEYDAIVAEVDGVNAAIERRQRIQELMNVGPDAAEAMDIVEQRARPQRPQAPAHHKRPTKDTPEAIMCRYIRSRGRDMGAAQEMHQASLDQYRSQADGRDAAEIDQAFREERASNDTIMNIATAADGGNLVPTGHYNRIIARKDESGLASTLPIMNIPGVGTTVNVPTDNEADSEFVVTSEQVDAGTNLFDRDAPAVGQVAMTLVKYSKVIELTDELLLDNDSNLMQWLEYRVGLGLAKTDNNLIVTEALANGTAALTLDNAASITAAEIPELVYLQADGYEDRAYWVMRKATFGHIMQKIGSDFQFAVTPGGTRNGELWGFPVATTGKMPAIGASNKSLLFGDFSFMGVRRMPGLTLLVNPYRKQGLVLLEYYYRVVFKVLQAAAIIYGTHPT